MKRTLSTVAITLLAVVLLGALVVASGALSVAAVKGSRIAAVKMATTIRQKVATRNSRP